MNKLLKTMKKNYIYGIMIVFLIVIIVLGIMLYKKNEDYTIEVENQYNLAFYELIHYMQDVETYLAKAMISSTPEHGAETLTNVWKEANLAQVYLSQLPSANSELGKASKFLNQVSEYSYALSRKNIENKPLSKEELSNIKELHDYSVELRNILEQLELDLQDGRISWKQLTNDIDIPFAQQVDNLSSSVFSNIDKNFGEYEGLIYDGAFSEHIERADKKGLTGEDISEEKAKEIAIDFIGKDRIKEISFNELMENAQIVSYDFSAKMNGGNDENPLSISISKKGGHVVFMNYNRDVSAEVLTKEDAKKIGDDFLKTRKIENMEPTYYLTQGGTMTINYAYKQNDVIVYPDLIEVKIALDNGEVLGIEANGYLNSHHERKINLPKISLKEAKKNLNKDLEITGEKLSIIPTKWQTEKFCYQFSGKIDGNEFLVYINADTGKEENVLLIINTPNGILAQ